MAGFRVRSPPARRPDARFPLGGSPSPGGLPRHRSAAISSAGDPSPVYAQVRGAAALVAEAAAAREHGPNGVAVIVQGK
jgi:hypothetical protein